MSEIVYNPDTGKFEEVKSEASEGLNCGGECSISSSKDWKLVESRIRTDSKTPQQKSLWEKIKKRISDIFE